MTVEVAAYILVGIFGVCGAISLAAAIFGWPWFFRSQGVRMLTQGLSLRAVRWIYGVAGVGIMAMAVKLLTDALDGF